MSKRNIILVLVAIILIGAVGYLAFKRESSNNDSFIGEWNVVLVERAGVQLVNGSNATIEFFDNGTYQALGGCNEMSIDSYALSNSGISFKVGGTKKKCAENIVEFWDLARVYSYELNDKILLLRYRADDGAEGIFRLQKF